MQTRAEWCRSGAATSRPPPPFQTSQRYGLQDLAAVEHASTRRPASCQAVNELGLDLDGGLHVCLASAKSCTSHPYSQLRAGEQPSRRRVEQAPCALTMSLCRKRKAVAQERALASSRAFMLVDRAPPISKRMPSRCAELTRQTPRIQCARSSVHRRSDLFRADRCDSAA